MPREAGKDGLEQLIRQGNLQYLHEILPLTTAMADSEMGNAIDEICRKSRAAETENIAS